MSTMPNSSHIPMKCRLSDAGHSQVRSVISRPSSLAVIQEGSVPSCASAAAAATVSAAFGRALDRPVCRCAGGKQFRVTDLPAEIRRSRRRRHRQRRQQQDGGRGPAGGAADPPRLPQRQPGEAAGELHQDEREQRRILVRLDHLFDTPGRS